MRDVDHETERDRTCRRLLKTNITTKDKKVFRLAKQTYIHQVIGDEFDESHVYTCHRCEIIGSYIGNYPYCTSCNWDSLTDPCLNFSKGEHI